MIVNKDPFAKKTPEEVLMDFNSTDVQDDKKKNKTFKESETSKPT